MTFIAIIRTRKRPPVYQDDYFYPVLGSAVSGEVIGGNFYALPLFQFLQRADNQLKVKRVRVVEVVLVVGGLDLLLLCQHLKREFTQCK